MIQPHLDVLVCIDAYWAQIFVGVGNDDFLVLLEGGQELSLMGGQILPSYSLTKETPQPLEEVVDAVVNLSWREGGLPGRFCS